MKFGLEPKYFQLLTVHVLEPFKEQGAKLWIFGSRATGKHKPFSDVDLMFELPKGKKLPSGFLATIKESIEESRFPYKVDIVNRSDVAESYKKNIEAEKVALEV